MRRLIPGCLVIVAAAAALFVSASPAVADPGIGNDAAFPVAGVLPNNVLEPVAGAPVVGPLLPPPAARITSLIAPPNAPGFGEIEDISYGDEMLMGGGVLAEISVGLQFGGGLPTGHPLAAAPPPPGVSLRQEAAIFPPGPFGDGATMSDIYQTAFPVAAPLGCGPVTPNILVLDDDGAVGPFGPRLGLNMPGAPGAGNIDAYERSEETPAFRPLPATGGVALAPTGIIFFTVDGATSGGWLAPIPAPGGGAAIPGPGDILAWNPAIGGPVIYATAAALGLLPGVAGDNVDGLAVQRTTPLPLPPFGPGWDFEPPGSATIVFSLAPGSPSLAPTSGGVPATPLMGCAGPGTGTAGDLWFAPAPVPIGGAPMWMGAEFMGLATVRTGAPFDDNLDAVDMCTVTAATDIDGDLILDSCDFDMDGDGTGNFIDPDDDGDGFADAQQTLHLGPANTALAFDNCPLVPNPAQTNTDGNFVDTTPPNGVDDRTWIDSDRAGDACDTDDDNDGLSDVDEASGAACAGFVTLPLVQDTDGDRFLDGAECALGSNPVAAGLKPALAACGPAGDADGDLLSDRVEFCNYGSNGASTDGDGDIALDGAKDGCEATSFNGDRIVNVGDAGILAAAIAAGAPGYHVDMDVDKNGVLNIADAGLVASYRGGGLCP